MDTDAMDVMRNQISNMGLRIEHFASSVYEGIWPQIKANVEGVMGEHLGASSGRQNGIDQVLAARIGAVETGLQAKVDGAAFTPLFDLIRAAQTAADANATAIIQAQANIQSGAALMDGLTASLESIVNEMEIYNMNREEEQKAISSNLDSGGAAG